MMGVISCIKVYHSCLFKIAGRGWSDCPVRSALCCPCRSGKSPAILL